MPLLKADNQVVRVNLTDLNDVNVAGSVSGALLAYDGGSKMWSAVTDAVSLAKASDVQITAPNDGDALVYNAATSRWVSGPITPQVALGNLTDVTLQAPAGGDVLKYNAQTQRWSSSPSSLPFDVMFFVSGTPTKSHDVVASCIMPRTVTIPAGFVGSRAYADQLYSAEASYDVSFTVHVNGSEAVALITFPTASTSASIVAVSSDALQLMAGDVVDIKTPAGVDTTFPLANIRVSIVSVWSGM